MKRLSLSPLVAGVRRWVSADDRDTRTLASLTATSAAELKRVRESEARLRQITDIAPVLLWVTDPDGLLTYVNKHWLDFTGQRVETELGDGWKDGIHPDDLHPYTTASNDAFARRQPFRTELRLRRFDGEYRWLLDVGSPMHDATGACAGYVGSCLDITDRKTADQALTTVSGRLLEAQEQERSRLASELHDDINQRLALLAIELEQLRLDPPNARKELVGRLDDLQQATLEISRDVQALSHELHSSKLDFLGLVPAFSSFFREFSQRTQVEVHFEHNGMPLSVPRDISLCLFRVMQEASHNVVKHSGVRRFDVELRGSADHARLIVRDSGKGFDPDAAINTRGLGLISMRERLGLIGGTLSIRSALNRGAEMIAEVPLTRTGLAPVRLK